jgi:transposase
MDTSCVPQRHSADARNAVTETRMQVLKEPGRANTSESRMWLSRGGDPLAPVCLYGYHERRNGEYPRALIEGCRAYLQTDGFEVYDQIAAEEPGITLVGCWAHARRRFHHAKKASKKAGAADEGMKYIRRLYQIETELRTLDLSAELFVTQRRERKRPSNPTRDSTARTGPGRFFGFQSESSVMCCGSKDR